MSALSRTLVSLLVSLATLFAGIPPLPTLSVGDDCCGEDACCCVEDEPSCCSTASDDAGAPRVDAGCNCGGHGGEHVEAEGVRFVATAAAGAPTRTAGTPERELLVAHAWESRSPVPKPRPPRAREA